MINFQNRSRRVIATLGSTAASMALMSTAPALAQVADQTAAPVPVQADEDAPAEKAADDIVVTGTLLRGIAPVGTNVVGLNREQITATGAVNTNDVLATIPQITTFFNKVVTSGLSAGGTGVPARPDIRNLNTFGGGNATLLLLDGQRLAGVGVIYAAADPNVVPPGALERVEVVADGGSSIYGSDAVGGVINMITRRRFSGLEVSGRAGFADEYYQYDGSVAAGTEWETGGVYASVTYSKHDDLFGRDRDYIRNITPSTSCRLATVRRNDDVTFAAPGFVAGTTNQCDTSDNDAWVPAERRYAGLAGFNQQFGDSVDLNVRAYYTNRRTDFTRDEARASLSVPVTNPFYRAAIGGTQNVSFSYGGVFGQNQFSRTDLEQWGVASNLTARLAPQWEARFSAAYSKSDLRNRADAINAVAQSAALADTNAATALNPYDIASTNPATLNTIRNWEEYARGRQNVLSGRGVIDGTLFSWGGGDVRVAVGGEYMREEITSTLGNRTRGSNATLLTKGGTRDIKSAYGELLIPVFGADNRIPGFHSLLISASGRYDHYSDFGDTFNPKIGIDWRPFSALRLRGNYGTSFNAPSLVDTNAVDQKLQIEVGSIFNILLLRPGSSFVDAFRPVFIVAGGNPELRPQKAKTFSFGFDFDVPFAPGLKLSSTYWDVNFKDQISLPTNCLFNANAPVCSRFIIANPTQAQVNAIAPGFLVQGSLPTVAAAYANPFLQPYALLDARRVNIGRVRTSGVDFNASLFRPTGFGSINANLGGSFLLGRRSVFLGTTTNDLATNFPRLNLSAGVGASFGDFGVQASLLHSGGYKTAATATTSRAEVDPFNVINLFFSYNLKGEGLTKDLGLTLSVNNVFDVAPPFINSGNGYANGSTLGRLIQFGVSKKF